MVELANQRIARQQHALGPIGEVVADAQHVAVGRRVFFAAAGERQAAQCREAAEQGAPRQQDVIAVHGHSPQVMARICRPIPDSATISRWAARKRAIRHRKRKWIVRADWVPPKRLGSHGHAAATAGDIDRPVSTITGRAANTTPRYASFCRIP